MPQPAGKIICTVTNDLTYDQRMIRICRSLSGQGFEVLLVGRVLPASVPLREEVFQQKRLRCFFQRGKLFYLEYNLRLLFFLLRQPFRLLCAVDLDTLVPAFLIARLKNRICVYDAHEYFTEVPEVVDRPFTKWVWGQVARRIIPRLSYAYTVGPQLAALFTREYGIPFATIRNLPFRQHEQITLLPANPKKIILYQGRLNDGRGLENAILAMQQIEHAELWLAGEGDRSEELRQLVRKQGLTEKVRFLGYLRPEALRDITLQAHIGLNLLENKSLSYYYSLANKAFDYIQAGLPSVQMDFPEYRALHDQFGVFALVPDQELSSLVECLQRLLTDANYWQQIHQHCLAVRDQLCWEEEEKRLAAFYRPIITGRP